MAKNTATSKGYRRQEKKKPFLTKKELIALIIIVAVLVAAFLIINWYPTRNFLRAREVGATDITAYARSEQNEKLNDFFVKLGEIQEYEGYTMETTGAGGANKTFRFYPNEESDIEYFEVRGGTGSAELLLNSIYGAETETQPFYDSVETTLNGLTAYVYGYSSSRYEGPETDAAADGTEPEPNYFYQSIGAYLAHNDKSAISMHVVLEGDNAGILVAEEDMVEFITPFADAFTVYTQE